MVWFYLIRLNLVRADYTQMQTETQAAFESTSVHETAKECVVFGSVFGPWEQSDIRTWTKAQKTLQIERELVKVYR